MVVFVCNPNQREAGPSFNWEKAQRLKKNCERRACSMKRICVFCKSTLFSDRGEPLGDLEAGRFQLVLKGLRKCEIYEY